MTRYTAAQARQNLSHLLDAAEQGERIVIERRGRRFGLQAELHPQKGRRPPALFDIVDPAVEKGDWTWSWKRDGLTFTPRKRRH